jgi:hypothetical protein
MRPVRCVPFTGNIFKVGQLGTTTRKTQAQLRRFASEGMQNTEQEPTVV